VICVNQRVDAKFDFDDTLVTTDSRVFTIDDDGKQIALTPHEYVTRLKCPDEESKFDYREFRILINPRPIERYVSMLRAAKRDCGASRVYVLSARSVVAPIEQFLASIDATDVIAATAGGAHPSAKKAWISKRLAVGDVDELQF